MYETREQAQADADKMTGWDNVRVVVEPDEYTPDGYPIIYIRADDPIRKQPVVFDSPNQQEARYI